MNRHLLAFITGFLIAVLAGYYLYLQKETGTHPIGYADSTEEVHVHSDFIVYLDGQAIDLTADKYQTTAAQTKHKHIHLHDNNDDVIHRHDHDITLKDFFDSLGFTLTNDCIVTDAGVEYCTNDTNQLQLYVNGTEVSNITDYINQEEDRLLMYYGDPEAGIVSFLLDEVTDKACIYSGTCPERGTPPPEACGITCEL